MESTVTAISSSTWGPEACATFAVTCTCFVHVLLRHVLRSHTDDASQNLPCINNHGAVVEVVSRTRKRRGSVGLVGCCRSCLIGTKCKSGRNTELSDNYCAHYVCMTYSS